MQILVVFADPDPAGFGRQVFDTVVHTLEGAGHEVEPLPLYDLGFRAAMSTEERRAYHDDDPIIDAQVREHAELVRAAEGLVFVYPSIWYGLPAMLKGWLERVLVTGVAFEFHPWTGKIRPGMRQIRRLAGVTTHAGTKSGVSKRGDGGRRTIARTLRLVASRRCRTSWIPMYATAAAGEAEQARFLEEIRGEHGAVVNVLVVATHPVPDSYGAAVRTRAVEALSSAGHQVDLLDLYADEFDPAPLTPATADALSDHRRRVAGADALVFVHPTWWGGLPAMVKGWLDQVLRDAGPLAGINRLAVVTTHGSTKWTNRLQGEPGKKLIEGAVAAHCNPRCKFDWIALYDVDRSTDADRARFLDRVADRLRRL